MEGCCVYYNYGSEDQVKLLSIIKKLGCITIKQLEIISEISNTPQIIEQTLKGRNPCIKRQGSIVYFSTSKIDMNMIKALDVFSCIYPNMPVSWYDRAEFPFFISFIQKNKLYDISYIAQGQEVIMSTLLNRCRSQRIIIVIDSKKEINKIKLITKHYKIVFLND